MASSLYKKPHRKKAHVRKVKTNMWGGTKSVKVKETTVTGRKKKPKFKFFS